MALNPCENLNRFVDAKIHELEQSGVKLRSEIEAFRNQLKDYITPPSALETLDNAIAAATVGDINAGSTALTQIKNFTGTCLDQVYNEARKIAAEIDGYIADTLDNITSFISLPEFNLLDPMRRIMGNLGILDLAALLNDIDKALGCLSDQGSELGECLDAVDNFNDRIEDVLRYTGLTTDGDWDIDNFVSNFEIDIDTGVIDNLKSLDLKVTSLATEAVAAVRNTIPSTVNPSSRF